VADAIAESVAQSDGHVRAEARSQTGQMGTTGRVLVYLLLVLVAIPCLFPFLWMISTSFMAESESITWPPRFIPQDPTLEHYRYLLTSPTLMRILPFPTYVFNSLYIALVVMAGRVFVCSLAGYGFARIAFPGSKYLFGMLLASLMVPGIIRLIPLYHFYKEIGWLNTHWPLIAPAVLANTFGTFLMRQFMMTLPGELEDAARIDGSGTFGIFWRIALPLSKPAMAVVAIFTFQSSWNDFTTPVLYIDDIKKTTLPVGLAAFKGEFGAQYELLMAGSVIALLPILAVYLLFQRYFVEGIALTGIKG
jgi:multiple sugar transport system permease protein